MCPPEPCTLGFEEVYPWDLMPIWELPLSLGAPVVAPYTPSGTFLPLNSSTSDSDIKALHRGGCPFEMLLLPIGITQLFWLLFLCVGWSLHAQTHGHTSMQRMHTCACTHACTELQ